MNPDTARYQKRVLFLDDSRQVLIGVERILWDMKPVWDMRFSTRPGEALEIARQIPFDVVVSDLRMPDMDGLQFLTEIRKVRPDAVCVILSADVSGSGERVCREMGFRVLEKPCDAATLKAAIAIPAGTTAAKR